MKSWARLVAQLTCIAMLIVQGFMLFDLWRYKTAPACTASGQTNCIEYFAGMVSREPPRTVTTCNTSCQTHTEYKIIVVGEDSKTHIITITERRKDITEGSRAQIAKWQGRIISIQSNGRVSYITDWRPQLLWYLLVVSIAALLIVLTALTNLYCKEMGYISIGLISKATALYTKMPNFGQGVVGTAFYALNVTAVLLGLFMRV